jgi:hypothetical protein
VSDHLVRNAPCTVVVTGEQEREVEQVRETEKD